MDICKTNANATRAFEVITSLLQPPTACDATPKTAILKPISASPTPSLPLLRTNNYGFSAIMESKGSVSSTYFRHVI